MKTPPKPEGTSPQQMWERAKREAKQLTEQQLREQGLAEDTQFREGVGYSKEQAEMFGRLNPGQDFDAHMAAQLQIKQPEVQQPAASNALPVKEKAKAVTPEEGEKLKKEREKYKPKTELDEALAEDVRNGEMSAEEYREYKDAMEKQQSLYGKSAEQSIIKSLSTTDAGVRGGMLKKIPLIGDKLNWLGNLALDTRDSVIRKMSSDDWGLNSEQEKEYQQAKKTVHKYVAPKAAMMNETLVTERDALQKQLEELEATYEGMELLTEKSARGANLKRAIANYDKKIKQNENYINNAGIGSAIYDNTFETVTAGIPELMTTIGVDLPILLKNMNGEELTEDEKEVMKSVAYGQAVDSLSQDLKSSYGYEMTTGIMQSIQFMMEMAIGGKGTKGLLTKGAREAIENGAMRFGKRALGDNIAGKALGKVPAGLGALASTGAMPSTYKNAIDDLVGIVQYDSKTDKIYMRDDLYNKMHDELLSFDSKSVKSQLIAAKAKILTIPEANRTDEQKQALEEIKAMLGEPSSSKTPTLEEQLKMYEPMSVAGAVGGSVASNMLEIVGERVVGPAFDNYIVKKLIGNKIRPYVNKYGEGLLGKMFTKGAYGAKKFNEFTSNTISLDSWAGETVEEYAVALGESAMQGSWDPVTEMKAEDVIVQTAVMGAMFRGAGYAGSFRERKNNKNFFNERKKLLEQLSQLRNATGEEQVDNIISINNSQTWNDISNQQKLADKARHVEKDEDKAQAIERAMFHNMVVKAMRTGTVEDLAETLDNVASNINLSQATRLNAVKAKEKVRKFEKIAEEYKGRKDAGMLMDKEAEIMFRQDSIETLEVEEKRLREDARKEIDELVGYQFNNKLAFDYDIETLFTAAEEDLTDEQKKLIDTIDAEKIPAIDTYAFAKTALDIAKKQEYEARKELRKMKTGEHEKMVIAEEGYKKDILHQMQLSVDSGAAEQYSPEELVDEIISLLDETSEFGRQISPVTRGKIREALVENEQLRRDHKKMQEAQRIKEKEQKERKEKEKRTIASKAKKTTFKPQSSVATVPEHEKSQAELFGKSTGKLSSATLSATKNQATSNPNSTPEGKKDLGVLINEIIGKVGTGQLRTWYLEDHPESNAKEDLKVQFTRKEAEKYAALAGVSPDISSGVAPVIYGDKDNKIDLTEAEEARKKLQEEIDSKKNNGEEPVMPAGNFNPLSTEFLPAPTDHFGDAEKAEVKEAVREMYEGLKEITGTAPTFEDILDNIIHYQGKDLADNNFDALKLGWDLNGYRATDFDKVYKEKLDPKKALIEKQNARLSAALNSNPSDSEKKKVEEKIEGKRQRENSNMLGMTHDNTEIRFLPGRKIAIADLKMAYNAIPYRFKRNGDMLEKETIFNGELNLKPESERVVDFRPLLRNDRFLPGEKVNMRVADKSVWGKIKINLGYNPDKNDYDTITFKEWYDNMAATTPNFESTQEFQDRVPIIIQDRDGVDVALAHEPGWYNAMSVADPQSTNHTNDLFDWRNADNEVEPGNNPAHTELILAARAEVRAMRNAVISGDVTEFEVKNKTLGAFYMFPEEMPEMSVEEANPQSVLAVQKNGVLFGPDGRKFENEKRGFINDPEDFRILDGEGKFISNGWTWDLRKVGFKDGKEMWVALPVTRRTDVPGENGIKPESLETLRWLWAAQARLNTPGSFNKHVPKGSKYHISQEKAKQIAERVFEITGINIANSKKPKKIADLFESMGVFAEGNDLSIYGANLYKSTVTGANLRQNSTADFLSRKKNVAMVDQNGDVQDTGKTYHDWLKTQLSTNVKSFNVGTEENPDYATSLQPVITYNVSSSHQQTGTRIETQTRSLEQEERNEINEKSKTEEKSGEKAGDETGDKSDELVKAALTQSAENGWEVDWDEFDDFNEGLSREGLPGDLNNLEILKNLFNITPGLNIKQEEDIVKYLFNKISIAINKENQKLDKNKLLDELRGEFAEKIAPKRREALEMQSKLVDAHTKNPSKKLAFIISQYQKQIEAYDNIEKHWGNIQDKALEEIFLYTKISETEEDVEADKIEEGEDNNPGEDVIYSKSNLEENPKQKVSYALKRLMAGIENTLPDGSTKKGFLGLETYIGFDDVYNSVAQFFGVGTDIPADWDKMRVKLVDLQKTKPWVSKLIKKLDEADGQVRNQFVVNYTKHALSMKFAMYDEKNGNVSMKMYDTNANEITRVIRDNWKSRFRTSDLVISDEKGYGINKAYAKELLDRYNSWQGQGFNQDSEVLRDFLAEFGIELPNEVWEEIKQGKFYYGDQWVPFETQFGNKEGLFRMLGDYLEKVTNPNLTDTDFEEDEKVHPHTEMQGVLKELSKMQAKYTTEAITLNFRDGGKQVSGQVPPKFVTERISRLKREILDRAKNPTAPAPIFDSLKGTSFGSESMLLKLLENEPGFASKLGIHHVGITALKKMGKKSNNFSSITDLNVHDHDLVKLTAFQDSRQGSIKHELNDVFGMRMANMFLPTMSDKDQMLFMSTGVIDLMKGAVDAFRYVPEAETKIQFTNELREVLYTQLVKPELKRIVNYHNRKDERGGDNTNIKDYDKAAQVFNMIPALNNVKDEDGIRIIKDIALRSERKLEDIEAKYKKQLMDSLESVIHQIASDKKDVWSELVTASSDGTISKVSHFNREYLNSAPGSLTERYEYGVYDFVINSLIANNDSFTAIAGDPALFAKNKHFGKNEAYDMNDNFYTGFAKATGVNIGKRMAHLIAPGNKLANSENEGYNQIFLADVETIAENAKMLVEWHYPEKKNDPKMKWLFDKYESVRGDKSKSANVVRKLVVDELKRQVPEIADFFEIEATDAQEYTTAREHIDVMWRSGKLSQKNYDIIQDKLDNGQHLTKEELNLVMQPIKPVYTGQLHDADQDVMRTMYIKSSSFPLLPQLTAGTKLDALRQKMEEMEAETGEGVRASYQSGNKVGAMSNAIDPFNPNSVKNAEIATLRLERKDFRIQQDVPFKSDKPGTDTVSMGTQMFKLLFGDGMLEEEGFWYKGERMNGRKLYEKFTENFGKLLETKKQELYLELGLKSDGSPVNEQESIQRLQDLLKKEAQDKGYPIQDVHGLEIEAKVDINGNVYYEFVVPLWLASNSNKYEALLNSIVVNRLMKHKMPGNAFVAGAPAGFEFNEMKEDGTIDGVDKSRVVYLDSFNGKELQSTKVERADTENAISMEDATKYAEQLWEREQERIPADSPVDVAGYELFPGVFTNEKQTEAIDKLQDFLSNPSERVFALTGKGGTGKTTIIKKALQEAGVDPRKVLGVTPTHAAKKQLMKSIPQSQTIHSALFIKLDESTGNFVPDDYLRSKFAMPVETADVIIFDEMSMVTKPLLDELLQFAGPNTKIVFMGDHHQLPPIGEGNSVSSTFDVAPEQYRIELEERMRQGEDSAIVPYTDIIADNIDAEKPVTNAIKDEHRVSDYNQETGEGVIFTNSMEAMLDMFVADLQKDPTNPEAAKIITFNNESHPSPQSVGNVNNRVREKMFGERAATEKFIPGEILTAYDTFMLNERPVFHNGTNMIVTGAEPAVFKGKVSRSTRKGYFEHQFEYSGYNITVELENEDGEIEQKTVPVVDDPQYKQDLGKLGKGTPVLYHELKKEFANVNHGYAITSHKSQGATYDAAYVLEDNIMGSPGAPIDKNRSLYVATSRPRKKLVMHSGLNKPYSENKDMPKPAFSSKSVDKTAEKEARKQEALEKQKENFIKFKAKERYDRDREAILKKNQVFIPSKFKANGELIDLFEDFNGQQGTYIYRRENGTLALKPGMIDEELLNLFSFRTPTSFHGSGSSVEIAGFLPPENGDLMVVPAGFTKQKGLDFDVDKETAYSLHHVIDKDGKVKVLSEKHMERRLRKIKKLINRMQKVHKQQAAGETVKGLEELKEELSRQLKSEGIDEQEVDAITEGEIKGMWDKYNNIKRSYQKKLYENDFVRAHVAVFNNPAASVQKKINKVLSMQFAGEQADMIESMSGIASDDAGFTILSDEYQKFKMGLGAAGKMAIGVYSNYLTFHALSQQTSEPIQLQQQMDKEWVPASIRIGNTTSDGKFGKTHTLDGSRTIADVFAEKQNTATDNEKEQILGRVNINSTTIGVDSFLTLLGFDKDENGNSIPYLMLSQPVIKDFVSMMSKGRGVLSDFDPNLEEKTIEKLINQYGEGRYKLTPEGLFDNVQGRIVDLSGELTGDKMLNGVDAKTKSNPAVQVAALMKFHELKNYATQIAKAQSVINYNELGKSNIESVLHKRALETLPNPVFANIEKTVGEFLWMNEADTYPEGHFPTDVTGEGKRLVIRPTTPQGQIVVNGVIIGNQMWNKYFPYDNAAFRKMMESAKGIIQKDFDSMRKEIDFTHEVAKEFKRYIFSRRNNGLFKENAAKERKRLFIDDSTSGHQSLATYLSDLKGKFSGDQRFAKGVRSINENKLMSKFSYDLQTNGSPSLIKFNNTSNDTFDQKYLYNSLPQMILENKPLPDFNGQPYSTRQLAQDLVSYAYLEGGVQEAIQFVKYIPVEYLRAVSQKFDGGAEFTVANMLQTFSGENQGSIASAVGLNTTGTGTHKFLKQYIQHHPEQVRQLSPEEQTAIQIISMSVETRKINEFMLKKNIGNPPFVSIKVKTKSKKKQDKWALFEFDGQRYRRIDVLGAHGMNEYDYGNENAQSIIGTDKPVYTGGPKGGFPVTPKTDIPFLITETDNPKDILDRMASTEFKKYPQISQLAKIFGPLVKPGMKFEVSDLSGTGDRGYYAGAPSQYKVPGRLAIDRAELSGSPDEMGRVFIHEFMHSITSDELKNYYVADQNHPKRGVAFKEGVEIPPHVKKINAVFRRYRQHVGEDKIKAFEERRKNNVMIDGDVDLIYPATNVFEFVAMMMENKTLQDAARNVKYEQTDKSLYDKFVQAITQMINSLSGGDNLTEAAIAEILNFVEIEHGVKLVKPAQKTKTDKSVTDYLNEVDSEVSPGKGIDPEAGGPVKRTLGGKRKGPIGGKVEKVPYSQLKDLPVFSDKGVNTMRKSGNQHFGNPFTGTASVAKNNPGLKHAESVEEAVGAYREWLETGFAQYHDVNGEIAEFAGNQEQRKWILQQIDAGKLDNGPLLYMSDRTGYHSHADELLIFTKNRRADTLNNQTPNAPSPDDDGPIMPGGGLSNDYLPNNITFTEEDFSELPDCIK